MDSTPGGNAPSSTACLGDIIRKYATRYPVMRKMQGDYLLRPLHESEIEEAADMTALAFMTSPGYHYIFEGLNDSERRTALKWLFSRNISLRLPCARCAWAWDDSQKKEVMVCFFMLLPPDAGEISVWAMLMSGILIMPFMFGLQSFRRLLEVKNHHDELAQSTQGLTGKYCTLERMVVHPKWQGKGVGSRCLTQGLQEAASRQQGVILFTQEEQNVTFYSRVGFSEVHREEEHPFRPTHSTAPVFNAVMVNTLMSSSPSSSSSSIKIIPFEARFQKGVQEMFAEGLQKQPPLALQKWFVASKLEADMGDIYKHYMSDDKGDSTGYGGIMFWVALDPCSPGEEKIAGCVAMMSSSYGEYDENRVHPMYEGMPGGPRDVCELVRMSVNPDYRGRGIGPRLVRVVEEKAREMQFKRLAISTLKVMEPAIALYTKCGASFVTLETLDITPRLGPIDPETGTEWDEVQVYHMKIDLY